MPDVTIRMRPNGPLVIEGPFKLVDSRGSEFEIPANKPAVALCRCGQSSKRPFCDGTHKTCGFVSDEAPTPPAVG
jgi:CDGSH-type Zn-finger protein